MAFNLGKPIFVMLICAIGAGTASTLTRRGDARADYESWVFSEQNFKAATSAGTPAGTPSLRELAERATGTSVSIKQVQFRALNTRISSMLMSGTKWPELPDLVDVEISSVARYFRPPMPLVELLPLNDFIDRHGWKGKLSASRLAPWSKGGTIFGIPQDVDPVMMVYNDEAFRAAGIDLSTSVTWDGFVDNCLAFQTYWHAHGQPRYWALEMSESNATTIVTMLLQRGVNLVDAKDEVHLTDPKTLDTLLRYCSMMAGPRRIGASAAEGNEAFSQDLGIGYVNVMLCPDWRLRYLKDYAPGTLAGKMRAMPLPAWPDSPYRTSTQGGTMVAIPRNSRDPEGSWRLIEELYLKPDATRIRTQSNYLLSAVTATWSNPAFDRPDPYFGGQPIKRLIADLAPGVPPRYVSPASSIAELELSLVMIRSIAYARTNGDTGLRKYCTGLLSAAEDRLKRQVEHGKFEE